MVVEKKDRKENSPKKCVISVILPFDELERLSIDWIY